MRWVVVASLGFLGCAAARLDFVPDAALDADVSRFEGAPAVMLLQRHRIEMFFSGADPWTEYSFHVVLKGLQPTRVPFVVRIPPADDSLEAFAARFKCPGEMAHEYDSSALRTPSNRRMKEFSFPPMKAGCTLEYSWTSNHRGPQMEQLAYVNSNVPIARYDVEIITPPEIRGDIAGYNGALVSRHDGNDGSSSMRVIAEDVMPLPPEQDAAPWSFALPWWQWRAVSLKVPTRVISITRNNNDPKNIVFYRRTWSEALGGHVPYPATGEIDAFDVQLETEGCDAWCLAQRAVDAVQKQTVAAKGGWNRSLNIVSSWRDRHASETERAAMVYALLSKHVPNVSLAYGTGRLNRMTTPAFPNDEQFDRIFVVVGESPKVARPFVIDPNCEGCVVGFVDPAYVDTPLFVFDSAGHGKFAEFSMQPRTDETRVQHLVNIDASGTLVDQLSRTVRGKNANAELRMHRGETDAIVTDIKRRVSASVSAAQVTRIEPGACSSSLCSWRAMVTENGEALRDDERWVIPLRFLLAERLDWMTPIQRDSDVYLKEPEDFEESAEAIAPPGFTLEVLPPPTRFDIDGFKMEIVFERTHDGVRVTRRLVHGLTVIPRSDYPRLHQAMNLFRALRQQQLVFVPKR